MPYSVAYQLYVSVWGGLDWLYPPQCGGCGVQGTRWCQQCASSLIMIRNPVCSICGQEQEQDQVCIRCQINPPAWDQLRSLARYGGALRQAILGLKYHRNLALGEVLAKSLIQQVASLEWQVDLVVPVPMDLARMHERGYNQVSLLAYPLSLALRLPYRSKALKKVRRTPRQVTLKAEQRRASLEAAFEADSHQVEGKSVLLIDDVVTTGATLEACSRALRAAGVAKIYALTLARAGYHVDPDSNETNETQWAYQNI